MTHMIVVGCGRVGSTLANQLVRRGHDVTVVDRKSDSFRRLGSDFAGHTVAGIGFDRDVLRAAGIGPESAVMAVTSGDNSNILIARVAREMFGVRTVVARIYDPRRAAIYQRLGIPTVATVTWATSRILSIVEPSRHETLWSDATSGFGLVEYRVTAHRAGRTVGSLEPLRVVLLTRNGQVRVPHGHEVIQEDDLIVVCGFPSDLEATLGEVTA